MTKDRQERISLAEARAARAGRSEAVVAFEQARLRFELAEAIRECREDLGWSQRQLAERAGMTQPGAARFEAEGTTPYPAAAGAPGRRARPGSDRQPGLRRPQVSLTALNTGTPEENRLADTTG